MLYKNTEILRSTVDQQVRMILEPDSAAPAGSYREVQLLIPLEPDVFISTEPDADRKYGSNRTYKMPPIPSGAQVTVRMLPAQAVYAAAHSGVAHIALTVEHHLEGPA